jgi:hypothetical protein
MWAQLLDVRKEMTQESTIQQYRGVLCRCCNQPIALPSIAAQFEAESSNAFRYDPDQSSARTYTLRCGICEKEYPYTAAAVVEFEGAPRARLTRANGARALGQRHRDSVKAANA